MKKTINHALIMAAGRGARLMPLTEIVPKAMVPYNGSTLIAIGIDKIRKHIPNIYITAGKKKRFKDRSVTMAAALGVT